MATSGPLRKVLAGGLGLVGAGDHPAVGIEEDGEVELQVVAALVEQVEDGAGVPRAGGLREVGREVGVGGEEPRDQPELLVALLLEGAPAPRRCS